MKRRWLCLAVLCWLTALCSGTGLHARLWSGKRCQTSCPRTRSSLGRGEGELAQNYPKVQHFSVLPALCRASPWQVSLTFLNSLPGIISAGNPLSWWGEAHTLFACGLHRGFPVYQAGLFPGMFHSVSHPHFVAMFHVIAANPGRIWRRNKWSSRGVGAAGTALNC